MSSSSKTANLQLNQWQRSDGICMDDFNADNATVDAAVKAVQDALTAAVAAVPVRRLMEVTTAQAAAQVDIDVSGIDFTQYAKIKIVPLLPQVTETFTIYLRLNDLQTDYYSGGQYATGRISSPQNYLTEFAWCNCPTDPKGRAADIDFIGMPANAFVSCYRNGSYWEPTDSAFYGFGGRSLCKSVKWSGLTKLNFYSDNGSIPAGTQFVIYGMK